MPMLSVDSLHATITGLRMHLMLRQPLVSLFMVFTLLFAATPALAKLGDVAPVGNVDGEIKIGDAVVALRMAMGLIDVDSNADVAPLDNPDGSVKIGDAVVILRAALGLVVIEDTTPNDTFADSALPEGYVHLNALRTSAGMTAYVRDELLEKSALNHANYNTTNQMGGHDESSSDSGFTGAAPVDRTLFVGYPSRSIGEGVTFSQGETGTAAELGIKAIDNLMSAIYHRFGLFSIIYDEIGMALSQTSEMASLVHNNGSTLLAILCEGTSSSDFVLSYTIVCTDPNFRIETAIYDDAKDNVRRKNPQLVLWPPENGINIQPAFYEESPDPLPDFSVSGYPVSVQFNEAFITSVEVSSFRLYQVSDGVEISNARLLDVNSDPNSKFSSHEFALFPLVRLDWNTAYRAELSYTADGENQSKIWQFTTQDLGMTIHTAVDGSISLPVKSGEAFAVYVPPTANSSQISGISAIFDGGVTLDISIQDQNTLKITMTGTVGQNANISHDDGLISLEITE